MTKKPQVARAQAEAQRMMVEKMFAPARVWQLLMFGHRRKQ